MAPRDTYRAQVDLLIRCLPAVAQVPEFALKGGTAINLFHHNMPRLSVDIDLTYLPISDRDPALLEIRSRLLTVAEEIRRTIPRVATCARPLRKRMNYSCRCNDWIPRTSTAANSAQRWTGGIRAIYSTSCICK